MNMHPVSVLSNNDPILGNLLLETPNLYKEEHHKKDSFTSICRIIVGQQLSLKAAQSIWEKAMSLVGEWNPSNVLGKGFESLHSCGLSTQKASSVLEVAKRIHEGSLDIENWDIPMLEIEAKLSSIKGFGIWSIEMFMIFQLNLPDIFSPTDAGLRRAVIKLYGIEPENYLLDSQRISAKWKPYRSHACRILWAWLDST